ncbi:MAG: thioredoxin-like domain-containing protein [Chitinophagaceae bacterium]
MKRIFSLACLLLGFTAYSQDAYVIKVTFKPYKKQYIYLGHYFGKQYPIIDSAMLNDKSEAVFKGNKKLQGGIYLVGYPNKAGFFEILVDNQQKFSVIADTATMKKGIQFVNSPDNVLFNGYQQYMSQRGKRIGEIQQQLKNTTTKSDSTILIAELTKENKLMNEYREEYIKKHPGNILSVLLVTMREPEMTGNLRNPKTREDSIASYNYVKQHYWDGVNFWDGRIAYTTFFEEKLDKYFQQLVAPQPDSVIKEIDWMMGYATANEEMTRFLLVKFTNRYYVQKYMWEDAIFLHIFEKYYAQKNYSWLAEKGRKAITERAYSLMANIIGSPAEEIELPDSTGKTRSLYADSAAYTLLAFWDPTCQHCKEVLPKLDSIYRAKWKALGVKLFAVAKETDGSKKDWMDFVHGQQLDEWTHVYYSKADDKARIASNIPGYSQLYDIQSFPTLYLLDKDKRIIAKKLTYQQMDEVLEIKMKGQ